MRNTWRRITVRWMMIAVAVAGIVSWVMLTAVLVARDTSGLSHLRLRRDTGEPLVQSHPIPGVFWPRYWRRLLGLPWPGTYVCPGCQERYERAEKHPLVDLAASGDGTRMLKEMDRINQARQEAQWKALLERSGR